MKPTVRRTAILAGLALTIACVGIAPATVAQSANAPTTVATSDDSRALVAQSVDEVTRSGLPQTVHVAGRQIPVDIDNGLYEMRGSLVGDWHYIPTEVLHSTDTLYAEAGVEVFSGCIDRRPRDGMCTERDNRGELHMAFLYWASFDLDGNFIRGQCVHPITGGRGAFAGARGLLRMHDRPVGDRVRTTYSGHIRLDAVPTEGDADTPSGAGVAGTVADQTTMATSGRRAC